MKTKIQTSSRHLAIPLRIAMESETYFEQAVALIQIPDRTRRLRSRARLDVERLTGAAIMGQLEKVLVDIVNSQGVNHVQTELSPERQAAKI